MMLPERSPAGAEALDVFYKNYNEVTFYVEDADQENLYFSILKRLFPGIEISRIFPLGGKSAVLGHAQNEDNSVIRDRVYIVDKDFDDLLGAILDINNVFYLDLFCIENLLIDQSALQEVIIEACPKLKYDFVRDCLKDDLDVSAFYAQFHGLFGLFFLAQLEDLGIQNSSHKPERFCAQRRLWVLDENLLSSYFDELKLLCEAKGCDEPNINLSEDDRFKDFVRKTNPEVISGKFVLAAIFHFVRHKFAVGTMTFDSFVYRMAKNGDLAAFSTLKSRIDAHLARA